MDLATRHRVSVTVETIEFEFRLDSGAAVLKWAKPRNNPYFVCFNLHWLSIREQTLWIAESTFQDNSLLFVSASNLDFFHFG